MLLPALTCFYLYHVHIFLADARQEDYTSPVIPTCFAIFREPMPCIPYPLIYEAVLCWILQTWPRLRVSTIRQPFSLGGNLHAPNEKRKAVAHGYMIPTTRASSGSMLAQGMDSSLHLHLVEVWYTPDSDAHSA